MKIIGTSENGFLIEATEQEIKAILKSCSGEPKEIKIGVKIPAMDYSESLRSLKSLPEHYDLKQIESRVKDFNKHFTKLMDDLNSTFKGD